MYKQKFLRSSLLVIAFLAVWQLREPLAGMLQWLSDSEAVTEAIQACGLWVPTILFVLLILQVFLAFIPGQALMVASGYVYGFTGGMLITWISLVLGGQAAFWLARRYGRRFAERWVSFAILDCWDKNTARQGIGFFALMLVLPLFPNDAMCHVAGFGKIPSRRFLVANMLGRGMASFVTVAVRAYGSSISAPTWIGTALLIVVAVIVWRLARKRSSGFLVV
jgi:uncharacterized membrane protein YdjX (TVP38/TMEM64 family)